MKTSVAITLIVCGTVLICVPHIHTVIGTSQVARLMIERDKIVNITGGMPPFYDTACLIAGAAMIIAGVIGAAARSKAD
jgi:hypothetical protein